MKNLLLFLTIAVIAISCNTSKQTTSTPPPNAGDVANDTVRIANDDVDYEIIIIEPGFNTWVATTARPEGYYGQAFLENRNRIMVTEWNSRVLQPQRYNHNLYEMQINYDPTIDYGYEVNYLLYNYFIYFQLKYNQRLSSFVPRI